MGDQVNLMYPDGSTMDAKLPNEYSQQLVNEFCYKQNELNYINKYLEFFASLPENDDDAKIDLKQLEDSLSVDGIPEEKKEAFKAIDEYTAADKKTNLDKINVFLKNVNGISKKILSLLVLHSQLSIKFKSKEKSINISEKFEEIINSIDFETSLQGKGTGNFEKIEREATTLATDASGAAITKTQQQNLLDTLIKKAEELVNSIGTMFSEKISDIKIFDSQFRIKTTDYTITQSTPGKPTTIKDKVKEYKNEIGQMKSTVTENVKSLVEALNNKKTTMIPQAIVAPATEEEEPSASDSDEAENPASGRGEAAIQLVAEAANAEEGQGREQQGVRRREAAMDAPSAGANPREDEAAMNPASNPGQQQGLGSGGAIGFSNKYDLLQIKNAIDKTLFNESSTNLQTQIPVQVRRNTQYGGSIDQLNLKKISLRNNQLFAKFNDGSKLPINSNTFYKIQRGGYNNNLSNTSTEISLCE